MSPKTTLRPAPFSFVGLPLGTTRAARSTTCCRRATAAGSAVPRSSNTAVNEPSGRSPKCSSRAARTRSESVPGTLNVFERRGESLLLAKPPARKTAIQRIRISRRWRSTNLVQTATLQRYPAGYLFGTHGPPGHRQAARGDRGALRRPLAGAALRRHATGLPADRRLVLRRGVERADGRRRGARGRPGLAQSRRRRARPRDRGRASAPEGRGLRLLPADGDRVRALPAAGPPREERRPAARPGALRARRRHHHPSRHRQPDSARARLDRSRRRMTDLTFEPPADLEPDTDIQLPATLPVLPLKETVVFPQSMTPL